MRRNRVIGLTVVPGCPATVSAFCNQFGEKITTIKTVTERNEILSDMEEQFRKYVRMEPKNRDALSEIYLLLKQKAWESI